MFDNKISAEQQNLFVYWEFLQEINNILVKCNGFKLSFPIEEIDKLDTSYDSYYDVLIEKQIEKSTAH